MDDPGRLDAFLADPNVPQDAKDAVASMLRGRTVQRDPSTWYGRAGEYALGRAGEVGRSALNVGSAMVGGLTGGTGEPQTTGQTLSDAANLLSTAVAPVATGAGIVAGATARALAASPEIAHEADVGTQLLGVGGRAAYEGIQAARGVRAAVGARFGGVAERAAARGDQLALGSPEANKLAAALQNVQGRLWTDSPQMRAARDLLNKLNPPRVGTVAMRGGPTYQELDDAYSILKKVSPVRGAINEAMQAVLSPEDAAARQGAQALFRIGVPQAGKNARWYQKPLRSVLPGGVLMGQLGKPTAGQLLVGAAGAAPGAARTLGVGVARGGLESLGAALAQQDVAEPRQQNVATPESPVETPGAPGPTPTPSQPIKALPGRWGREIAAVSSLTGVPGPVIQMFMNQESGGRPGLTSHPAAGQIQTPAQGLMQITPGTFRSVAPQAGELLGRAPQLGNPFDDLLTGGLLLRRYLDKTGGDLGKTAAMYHGGENPAYWGPHTRNYVSDIDRRWAEASKAYGAGG